jgi:hypothetical protein
MMYGRDVLLVAAAGNSMCSVGSYLMTLVWWLMMLVWCLRVASDHEGVFRPNGSL